MAGQDQSANLGGMLTDIGKTVGSMGDAYKPVLQAATKPQGDMNDPVHLANLAQWATQHGDTAAASMYMTQSREAKAEQKAAKNVAFVGKTGQIAASAQQRAQEGDVTNLDRNIAELKRRVQVASESGEPTQLASAQSALKSAIASRDGADKVQVGNHIKAVTAIDSALADPAQAGRQVEIQNKDGTVTKSTVGAELIKRRDELLSDQRVSDGIIEREVEEFQQRKAEITVRGTEFLDGTSEQIRQAIARGDEQALSDIQESMPGDFGTQGERMFNDYVADAREIEADILKREELAAMDVAYDFEEMDVKVADLKANYPELMDAINLQAAKLKGLESQRNPNGSVMTPKLILTARSELEALIATQRETASKIELRVRLDREHDDEKSILRLERQREEGYKPNEEAIRATVSNAVRFDPEYLEAKESEDWQGMQDRQVAIDKDVRRSQSASFYSNIDSQLSTLGVEVEKPKATANQPPATFTNADVTAAAEARGITEKKARQNFINAGSEFVGEEVVDEPKMYRREPGLPRDIFGIEDRYNRNIAKQRERMTPQ